MECLSCGQRNPAEARFCMSCGAATVRTCPSCNTELQPEARFCISCGARLGEGEITSPLQQSTTTQTAAPSSTQPTSFVNGRYQVKRFLGEGGKKKVYLSDDTVLDRDVAFATIKTEGLDEVGRQRIRREAQAMGRLGSHPHIVTVFELGELEDGQPYMVTELMEGGDVEALIKKAPDHKLTLERAIEIAVHVCRGLEFAHFKEIVHRDLKPGNVWLTTDGVAKIGDFGLHVALDRSRLTQIGMMVGTVSYMPPEQAMGGEPVKKSDLYSLGAMLYEMVTGRPPFVGDDNIGIISQHINTPPVSPSWHRPDLPPVLEGLILRLLEKDPGKRPATAHEVLQALESINLTAHPEPVEGPDGSLREPQGKLSSPRADMVANSPIYRRTFVGREAELKGLHTAFDNAMSGVGSMAMVVGEPGIGKTAFCEQLAAYVALRGGRTLVGHCYEEGSLSLPYLAFVEAMRTYVLTRPPEALREELGAGATEVARIVSEVREKVQLEPRPPGNPEDDRWRLLQAVTSFLRNAASTQPIMLVLEDLHWSDRGTLDLLVQIARNLSGARLLVVGTYRDVEVDRAHPLSSTLAELRRVGELQRVLLRGLTVDEVHRMIKIIGGQEVSWALAEAIHRQTEGNPLFIQEVLRYVVEEGLVTRQDGRWQGTGDTPLEMSIPEGLRDVIGKRLSRLGPECNRVLAIASVIGRDFGLETLRRVTELDEDTLIGAIEEALKIGVLEEQSRPGMIRYRFAHAFFRQTLYEEMSAPRRLRLHQQVARALESQYAGRLDEHASEMAEHFAQSTDPADLGKAVHYSELAAHHASAVYAYSEAARLLEQALEVQEILDSDDKAKRCDLLLALGDALMSAGEPLRVAEEVMQEAFLLAETLNDVERAARASQTALAALRRYGGAVTRDADIWREWTERADRYAAPGTIARVHADLALADLKAREGSYRDARFLSTAALDLARKLGDYSGMIIASGEPLIQSSPRHEHMRLSLAEELLGLPREKLSAFALGNLLYRSTLAYLDNGQRDRAEELCRQLEELAGRSGDQGVLLLPFRHKAILHTLDGHFQAALEDGASLASQANESGSPVSGRLFAAGLTLYPLLHLGRAEEAIANLPHLGRADTLVVLVTTAKCLAAAGRTAEAQDALRRAVGRSDIDQVENETPTWLQTELLEAALLLLDREVVSLLAPRLSNLAHLVIIVPFTAVCTSIARLLGASAALLGDREKAKAYYQQALEVCAKIRFRPEIALTRLQLAELLLEEAEEIRRSQGRGDLAPTGATQDVGVGSPDPTASVPTAEDIYKEAMEHLDFAISEFQEMKMQPSLERALRHKGLLKA